MKEMLGGALTPGVSGQLAEVCVLFSDVRDFTTLSENMPPQVVTTVLQRYFDRMVHAVHRYDGTVDKFIGDGMMVLFGAPRKSKDPCGEAVQCALAMLMALDSLNEEFKREGLPTLTIGIGINYGTVTVGNIGSSERHNYSAIGDPVNVAARVEGLTKELGRKIIITEAVVSRIEERFHFDPLGIAQGEGAQSRERLGHPHGARRRRRSPIRWRWFDENNPAHVPRWPSSFARQPRRGRGHRLHHQHEGRRGPRRQSAADAARGARQGPEAHAGAGCAGLGDVRGKRARNTPSRGRANTS